MPGSFDGAGRSTAPGRGLGRDVTQTIELAGPLAIALLAQTAMGVTDTVLLGGLSGEALAAGGLGAMVFITTQIVLQGVLAAVSILAAQARGAARDGELPALYWSGMILAAVLAVPAFALFGAVEPLLLLGGEPAGLARDVGHYVWVLRWAAPGAMLQMGLLRAFMPAIGGGSAILGATVGGAVVNGALCYGLIHGVWGLPAMGLRGAALASVTVMTGVAVALMALLHLHPVRRRFVGWSRPQIGLIVAMLRLGTPVAAAIAVEAGLFLAVSLLIGNLGPAPLAAQQVALNVVSVAFMVPLGLAQAANIRVGFAIGAGDAAGARRAGLVAIGLSAAWETACAFVTVLLPQTLVGWHLDPADTPAFGIAVSLLGVAAAFQIADGVQCVAAGALRGLGDTRGPFTIAALGYWGVAFPAAWWLTLRLGATGAWWGLAAGLFLVAALLTRRFLHATRFFRATGPGRRWGSRHGP